MPRGAVTIPRKVFDAFVDWYATGVWVHPRRMKAKMIRPKDDRTWRRDKAHDAAESHV